MRSLGVISSAGAVLYHEVTANYVGLKIRQYNTHTHTHRPHTVGPYSRIEWIM